MRKKVLPLFTTSFTRTYIIPNDALYGTCISKYLLTALNRKTIQIKKLKLQKVSFK
jgi:hypothetical protein